MQDAPAVSRGQPTGHAQRTVQRMAGRHRLVDRAEQLTLHVLGDQIRAPAGLTDPVDGHDIRMLDAGRRPRFGEEVIASGVVGGRQVQEADDHRAIEHRVMSQTDLAARTFAERHQHAIAVEGRRHRPLRGGARALRHRCVPREKLAVRG
jgi:hypothetical protein